MATNTNITTSAKTGSGNSLGLAWTRVQSIMMGDRGTAARARLGIHKALGDAGANIRATAVDGYVELRGTVASKNTYQQAAEVARATFGAKGVLNFLDVR